jgi:hypothetical protein
LGDICVLTEKAAKVAPYRGNGIGETARTKMKKGFFFDGIDILGDQMPKHERAQAAVLTLAHTAESPLALLYKTTVMAKVAANAAVVPLTI